MNYPNFTSGYFSTTDHFFRKVHPHRSLNITPHPHRSLTIKPFATRDKFTGARLAIGDDGVRFEFNGGHHYPSTIYQIDKFTGAKVETNIVNRFRTNPQIQFGSSLEIADINGDSLDDLIVGAPNFGDSGLTFYYLGTTKGLVFDRVEVGSAPGVNDRTGSGDFNGDSIADIVAGDPDAGSSGQVFVTYGATTGLSNRNERQILDPRDVLGLGHSPLVGTDKVFSTDSALVRI